MAITITGSGLTVADVVTVARHRQPVELPASAVERIARCRTMLETKLAAGETVYGVNTGVGELVNVQLPPEKIKDFQRYLVRHHAAGIGDPMSEERVRAAMLARLNVLSKGYSGCRVEVAQALAAMLNAGITPVVCEKGSVGACGDLQPMSQIALVMMGEGEAFVNGQRLPGAEAMRAGHLEPVEFEARDGIALINGSNFITGIGCLLVHDVSRWLIQAEICAAVSFEALLANLKPYDGRIHTLRGFGGAIASAANIRACLDGSDLLTGKMKSRVQDAYSMRATPQVVGAARDQLRWTKEQLEIELNGVGDNPIFVAEDNDILTGANFQGTPVGLPLDTLGSAVTMVSVLSERRLNRLINPALSAGLPAFLSPDPGFFSGLMLSQYTADMLIVEQRILSTPASIQSIPAAADQEDFVSMGMNAALKTGRILDNAYGVLGIEFIAACQALDFREFKPGKGVAAAHRAVRAHVAKIEEDRELQVDHNRMKAVVEAGDVLTAVEAVTGPLCRFTPAER